MRKILKLGLFAVGTTLPVVLFYLILRPILDAPMFWDNCQCAPYIVSSVLSPSGRYELVKRIRGDVYPKEDVLLIDHRSHNSRTYGVFRDLNQSGTFGSDGMVVSWEGDHTVMLAWPLGAHPLVGPTRVDKVNFFYQTYQPNLDLITGANETERTLEDLNVRFAETTGTTGSKYKDTGKPVPEIKCMLTVSGMDPTTAANVKMKIVANGIGQRSSQPMMIGITDLSFLEHRKDGQKLTPTQAKLAPDQIGPESRYDPPLIRQLNTSLIYENYPNSHPKLLSTIRSANFSVHFELRFGEDHRTLLSKATCCRSI